VGCEGGVEARPGVDREAPHPPQELDIESLRATLGLDSSPPVSQRPPQYSSEAAPPAGRQHDDGVGAGEADVERAAVIAVDDPATRLI